MDRIATITRGERAFYIVHEINQPLTAVHANAEAALRWLAHDNANVDEAKNAIRRVLGNSHLARDVARNLGLLYRREAAAYSEIHVNALIKDVLALMMVELHQQDVVFETDLADNVVPVRGEKRKLESVLVNLVMNGIEAMPPAAGQQRLRISTGRNGRGDVVVAIADNGSGIAPAEARRIFEPWFTTKAEGLGLGLPMSQLIVECHGGRLWATPNTPRGSVFQFSIPTTRCYLDVDGGI